MMESDKELGVHRCLLGLFLGEHRRISLPVELLKSPLAGSCQGPAQVIVVRPGHNPRRGYGHYCGGLSEVDTSDIGT